MFVATAVLVGSLACHPREEGAEPALTLSEVLAGADTAGYARAVAPRGFDFPADHGPHPSFRSEWWYVTGNLESADGRDFGFQLTIFRNALAPEAPELESAWATRQAYLAHFTVTDVAGGRFHAFERYARGAAGLAGANARPLRVWLEGWSLEGDSSETFPIRLTAEATAGPDETARPAGREGPREDGSVALHLTLEQGKPPVLQGERGLSRKGPEEGNASYYYSLTRMPASGTLVLGADTLLVEGGAWLDREWSTSALSEGVVGWDWYALQLDDGRDLMIYRLRTADGAATSFSEGVLVDAAGTSTRLVWDEDVVVESTGSWRSPVDGTVYPSGWRVRLPERGWDLEVAPRVADQELALSFRYWEGAVSIRGTGEGGAPVTGRGYVELTGYADAGPRGGTGATRSAPPR